MPHTAFSIRVLAPHSMAVARTWRRFARNRLAVISLGYLLVVYLGAVFAPSLAPVPPEQLDFTAKLVGPNARHLLGTDNLGRDLLSRLIYGSRASLSIGLAAVVISIVVGMLVGLTAAYYGGWVDRILMRLTDGMLSIPVIFLLITVLTVFSRSLLSLIFFIGMTRWMAPARIVRADIIKQRNLDYVLAAQALGLSNRRILFRHLLPQAIPSMVVTATFGIAQAILIESAVSYLGLGIQPPTPSWGNMLSGAQNYIFTSPTLALYPGLMIFFTVLAYNSFGDGLRDVLDASTTR